MKQLSARLFSILIRAGISVAAIAMAACFICVAAYSYLCTQISAPLAALAVAVLALIVGLIMLAMAKGSARRLRDSLRPAPDGRGGLGSELGEVFGAHLQDVVRKNPRSVVIALMAGGLALSVSSGLRKNILRFFFH